MKRLIRSMFGTSNAELLKKAQAADEQINKVNESYTAFMSAAGDTLSLAKDVTVGLRDRIDDYTNQIEATSLVIPDALILVSDEGKLENINVAAEQIFGFCKSEFLQKTVGDLFTDSNGGVTLETIQDTFRGVAHSWDLVRKGKLTIRGITKDGDQFYPNIKISEFERSDGSTKFMLLVQDITEHVEAEQLLLESEEHFRVFGQASNEAMMIHNDTGLLDWNPRLTEMTGFTNAEIAKMRAEDFIHPMERSRIGSSSDMTNKAYTTLFRTKTGGSVEVAINERVVDWRNAKARIKVIRDITHLKDVEQILHLSRERYKSITDNTFDVVACYGMDLCLTFVNQTFLDYFGKPFTPNTSLLEAIDIRDHQRVLSHLTAITVESPVKRTLHRVSYNGETRWLDWIDRAVFDDNGKFLEFQGIGRDVTDYIKRAKEISR